jgi:hypothetical protein
MTAVTPTDRALQARREIERAFGRSPFVDFFDRVETVIREVLFEAEIDIRREYGGDE